MPTPWLPYPAPIRMSPPVVPANASEKPPYRYTEPPFTVVPLDCPPESCSTPGTALAAAPTVMETPPDDVPEPEDNTSAPPEYPVLMAEPAAMATAPPLPLTELPPNTLTAPAAAPSAFPDPTYTDPLTPAAPRPLENTTEPLTPFVLASALVMYTLPLDDDVLEPASVTTWMSPSAVVPAPLLSVTVPPSVVVPVPPKICTTPAVVDVPASIRATPPTVAPEPATTDTAPPVNADPLVDRPATT